MPAKAIEAVLAERTEQWMSIAGVTGTGIGLCDDQPCLVVFINRDTEELRERIPERVEGYVVDFRVTGEFTAQDSV